MAVTSRDTNKGQDLWGRANDVVSQIHSILKAYLYYLPCVVEQICIRAALGEKFKTYEMHRKARENVSVLGPA